MKEVVIRLNGGLGNQMFQYAFAKAKAREVRARLLVDRSMFDLPYIPERYRLDAFNLDLEFTGRTRNFFHRTVLSPKLPKTMRDALTRTLSIAIRDEAAADEQPTARTTLYVGYFQRPAVFAAHLDELRRDFMLTPAGQRVLRLKREINATPSVAVHVRRGEYATVPLFRETLGVLSANFYRGAMDVMRNKVQRARFFVFSNDHKFVRQELVCAGNDVVLVDLGADGTDLSEMALMRECRHFILGNSTFSWWPAVLADRPNKIILAPKPWFRQPQAGGKPLIAPQFQTLPSDWERT